MFAGEGTLQVRDEVRPLGDQVVVQEIVMSPA
jgi:hypothetical protein